MSLGSVIIAAAAKVLAQTSATSGVNKPIGNDFSIPAGETYFRGVPLCPGDEVDSNNTRQVLSYQISMIHNLSDPTNEGTYLLGDALSDQGILGAKSFWRTISGVHELLDGPEFTLPERIGNVIEYTISIQLSIDP